MVNIVITKWLYLISSVVTLFVRCQEVKPKVEDYPTRVPGTCSSSDKFDCGNGKCIDFNLVRNCVDDCGNAMDESCGAGLSLCDTLSPLEGCGKCVITGSEALYCDDQRYTRLCSRPSTDIFKCVSTPNCILTAWILNGENECGDLSDENPCFVNRSTCHSTASCTFDVKSKLITCTCPATSTGNGIVCTQDPLLSKIPGKCSSSPLQFDCGEKCISIKKLRDCVVDCADGSDESCFQGTSKCSDGCTCVQPGRELLDCPNTSGSKLCGYPNTVKCPYSNNCIYNEWVLDRNNDCGDYTDEDACLQQRYNCSANADCFSNPRNSTYACQCKTGYIGTGTSCVRSSDTTPNKTDILSRIPGSCKISPLEFDCGNGVCISIDKFRDCRQDCVDGSDETCWTGQVKCDGCKCVDAQDLKTSCQDSAKCVQSGLFQCASGGCTFDEMVLDGVSNCPDGSDENYCTKPILTCSSGNLCRYTVPQHSFTCGCPTNTAPDNRGFCRSTGTSSGNPADCAGLQTQNRNTGVGIYTVYNPTCANPLSCPKQVYCDFDLEGGGWTIIQHRVDSSVDFNRTFTEYKNGFGSLSSDFWLGNDFVQQLTNLGTTYELLIVLTTFDATILRARYNNFQLAAETDYYRLTLGTFVEGDNDNLAASRNQRFGTRDTDVDSDPFVTCGQFWRSGWWHQSKCDRTGDLNVPYDVIPPFTHLAGIIWTGTSRNARMKETKMMIRPIGFVVPSVVITTTTTTTKPIIFSPPTQSPLIISSAGTAVCAEWLVLVVYVILCTFMNQ